MFELAINVVSRRYALLAVVCLCTSTGTETHSPSNITRSVSGIGSTYIVEILLPCDAMCKCGLYCGPLSVCHIRAFYADG